MKRKSSEEGGNVSEVRRRHVHPLAEAWQDFTKLFNPPINKEQIEEEVRKWEESGNLAKLFTDSLPENASDESLVVDCLVLFINLDSTSFATQEVFNFVIKRVQPLLCSASWVPRSLDVRKRVGVSFTALKLALVQGHFSTHIKLFSLCKFKSNVLQDVVQEVLEDEEIHISDSRRIVLELIQPNNSLKFGENILKYLESVNLYAQEDPRFTRSFLQDLQLSSKNADILIYFLDTYGGKNKFNKALLVLKVMLASWDDGEHHEIETDITVFPALLKEIAAHVCNAGVFLRMLHEAVENPKTAAKRFESLLSAFATVSNGFKFLYFFQTHLETDNNMQELKEKFLTRLFATDPNHVLQPLLNLRPKLLDALICDKSWLQAALEAGNMPAVEFLIRNYCLFKKGSRAFKEVVSSDTVQTEVNNWLYLYRHPEESSLSTDVTMVQHFYLGNGSRTISIKKPQKFTRGELKTIEELDKVLVLPHPCIVCIDTHGSIQRDEDFVAAPEGLCVTVLRAIPAGYVSMRINSRTRHGIISSRFPGSFSSREAITPALEQVASDLFAYQQKRARKTEGCVEGARDALRTRYYEYLRGSTGAHFLPVTCSSDTRFHNKLYSRQMNLESHLKIEVMNTPALGNVDLLTLMCKFGYGQVVEDVSLGKMFERIPRSHVFAFFRTVFDVKELILFDFSCATVLPSGVDHTEYVTRANALGVLGGTRSRRGNRKGST